MNFPPEESEENDLIRQQPETPEQDPTASKNKLFGSSASRLG